MANKPSNHPTSKYQINPNHWYLPHSMKLYPDYKNQRLTWITSMFHDKILFRIVSWSNLLKPPTVCPFLLNSKTHWNPEFPSWFSPIPSSAPHPTDTPGTPRFVQRGDSARLSPPSHRGCGSHGHGCRRPRCWTSRPIPGRWRSPTAKWNIVG